MPDNIEYLRVDVRPSSKISEITCVDGAIRVRLKSRPVDGKANKELLSLLSGYLRVRQSDIKIKSGKSGKRKLIQVFRKEP